MAGVFVDTVDGGVSVRSATGVATGAAGVANAYVPPGTFTINAAETLYGSDCAACHWNPATHNALVSELIAFSYALDPHGSWDAAAVDNVAVNFASWMTRTGPGSIGDMVANAVFAGAATLAEVEQVAMLGSDKAVMRNVLRAAFAVGHLSATAAEIEQAAALVEEKFVTRDELRAALSAGINVTALSAYRAQTTGVGTAVVGLASGAAAGHGVYGEVVAGATGPASGVVGVHNGSGAGSAGTFTHSGTGAGHAINASVTGTSQASGIVSTHGATGNGHGGVFDHHATGNGHAITAAVGGAPTATGTGVAIDAIAYDIPGTHTHPAAVRGTVAHASQYAGYFNGNVHATGTVTSSDERIKSEIGVPSDDLVAAARGIAIKTYRKHLNGRVVDEREGDRLKAILASLQAAKEPDVDAIARAQSAVTEWDAADWDPIRGQALPGRLAGVVAQDVEAVAPEFVQINAEGIKVISETSVLFLMMEDMRRRYAALAAEFSAYKAAHP